MVLSIYRFVKPYVLTFYLENVVKDTGDLSKERQRKAKQLYILQPDSSYNLALED